jgi:large repetitive protein
MSPFLATFLLAPLIGADRSSAAATYEVRGRIVADGKALAGARVEAVPLDSPLEAARLEARGGKPGAPLAVATTAPDGAFLLKLSSPPPADLHVLASAAGFVPARAEASTDSIVELSLVKGQALSGRVVDPTGGPVLGATVALWQGRAVDTPLAATATTDAKGAFHFDTAAAAGNRLRVEAPGLTRVELGGLRGGTMTAAVKLSPGRVVRGIVLLPDGRTRAGGALVRFEGASPSPWTEARADGSFMLQGLGAGPGRIVAEAGDAGNAKQSLNASDADVKVVLARASMLRGHVIDAATRKPVVGARITASATGEGQWSARSGAGGSYEVRGLPAQGYVLSVEAPRYAPWSRRGIRLEAGKPTALDVPLSPAASLSGKVVDAKGTPLEGAVGRLVANTRLMPNAPGQGFRGQRGDGGSAIDTFRTAKDGTFKLDRLAPGDNQELVVRHDTHQTAIVGGLALKPGTVHAALTIVLPQGLALQGVVHDDQGHPVPAADVDLMRNPGFGAGRRGPQGAALAGPDRRPQVQTGPDGRFRVQGLSTGDWILTVSKSGFAREVVDPVKVTESSDPLDVALRPGAAIRGFVHNRAGDGVAGYRVTVGGGGGGGGFGFGRRRGLNPLMDPTGPDGAFSIDGLDEGAAYDVVAIPERGPSVTKRSVAAPADGVELTVADRGTVLGTVTDAEGRPVTDFVVSYAPEGRGGGQGRGPFGGGAFGGASAAEPTSLHSDDGSFALDDVPPGRWSLEATASGFQRGRAGGVVVEEGGTTRGVAIRLSRGGVVSGRVVEARSGQPVLGATVMARLSGATGGGRGPGTTDTVQQTDDDGRYEIGGLAPGNYTLTARHPDWSDGLASVELKDATATADIRLGTGGSLTGTVVTGGRPTAGATVALRGGMGGGGGPNTALSDAAGRFRFDRLAAGRYEVTASLGAQSSTAVDAVVASADATQDITVALGDGATIRGIVSGLNEGQLAGVRVSANGPESYGASARTSLGGAFELSGAPVGTIQLRADAGDITTGVRSVTSRVIVAQGQAEVAAELVFPPGHRLDGHVTRATQPVAGAMVSAGGAPGVGGRGTARTDDGGAYALDGLPDGTYMVRVVPAEAGTSAVTRSVELAGDVTFDIELPAARIAGTVVEAGSQQPLADAAVGLLGGRRGGSSVVTDSTGRFAIEGLDPATYHLTIRKAAYTTDTRDVAAADDTELRIELHRGEGIVIIAKDGIYGMALRSLLARVIDPQGTTVFNGGVTLDGNGQGEIPSLPAGAYQMRLGAPGYAPIALPSVTVPTSPIPVSLTPGGALDLAIGATTLALPGASAELVGAGGIYFPSLFSVDGRIRLTSPVQQLANIAPGHYRFVVAGGVSREIDVREGARTPVSLP